MSDSLHKANSVLYGDDGDDLGSDLNVTVFETSLDDSMLHSRNKSTSGH